MARRHGAECRLLYFGGAPTQFDNALINGDETGVVVVHRTTADEPWEVYADQTINAGSLTNGTGSITMDPLRKGQYAFAKINGAIGVPEEESGSFAIHPVPTNDRLTMRLDRPAKDLLLLDVITTDGRLVQRTGMAPGVDRTTLNVADLATGNYILRITDTQGVLFGARKFQIAR